MRKKASIHGEKKIKNNNAIPRSSPPTTVGGGLESVCLLEEMAEDRELEVSLQEMAIDAGKYMKL